MRQQSHSSYTVSRRINQKIDSRSPHSTALLSDTQKRRTRTRQGSSDITVTPLRGFFIALLFLGVPTVSLGGVCFLLLQNNLKLSKANSELNEIAHEVTAEIDVLGDEIDSLKARAGVPDGEAAEEKAEADEKASAKGKKASAEEETNAESARGSQDNIQSSLSGLSVNNAGMMLPVKGGGTLAKRLKPQGGPENAVTALDLLENAQQQVPELNRALASAVKPALEKALAEEAAYPTGQPVVGRVVVSSEYGIRSNPFSGSGYEVHEGIDFVGDTGDIIAATGDGKVTLAGPHGGYGNTVTIDHGYGYETLYAHMSKVRVKVGDRIKRGQIIGHIGSTGRSSGPHLHYSLYKNDKSINPRTLMKLSENFLADGPR